MVDEALMVTRAVQSRLRDLPSRVVIYLILAACLFPEAGYPGVWRKLTGALAGLPLAAPTASALTQARRRVGSKPLRWLFDLLRGPAPAAHGPGARWRGLTVVALDGTILTVPDTPAVLTGFTKQAGNHGGTGYPQVRLLTLVACGTRTLIDAVFGPTTSGQTPYAPRLLPSLRPGMILLADRNFAAQKGHWHCHWQGHGHGSCGGEHRTIGDGTMALVHLAKAGDVEGVLRELGALTPQERAAQAEALEAWRASTELMQDPYWWQNAPDRELVVASYAAELGCRTDPMAAADWLLERRNGAGEGDLFLDGTWILDVLNLHPVTWRAELAAQLAERMDHWSSSRADLVEHLIHDTGCPVPTSTEVITGWLNNRESGRYPAHFRGGPRPGATFLERLRADDLSPKFLPLALERVALGVAWFHDWRTRHGLSYVRENTRLGAFISLSTEGLIDRAALIRRVFADLDVGSVWGRDAAVALTVLALTPQERAAAARERLAIAEPLLALLQDCSPQQAIHALAFLRALALTPAENAAAVKDHMALLDLSSSVAGYGQEVLIGLDEAWLLEPDVFTEVCERVLLRPEKKLVRAQLTRLDRAARRDSARAARTVLDAAIAFDHRDLDLQERALDVVARHLKAAGDSVLPQLRTAAARISPGLAPRAADLFGTAPDHLTDQATDHLTGQATSHVADQLTASYADLLLAVPEPRPVPGPIETAVEVAEELAAVVADDKDVVRFERVLDGLVRHAHRDREVLAQALQPVMRKEPRHCTDCTQSGVYDVAAALRGDEPRRDSFLTPHSSADSASPAAWLLKARLVEAIDVIEAGAQSFLLAVPTDATGALDAAVLVERISVLEGLDGLANTPAPVDLAQALLRVTPTTDKDVLDAAGRLGSEAGQRLAQWLREGGLPHWDTEPPGWSERFDEEVSHLRPGPALGPPLLPAAETLLGPYNRWAFLSVPMAPFWLAQLPHHRDVVLARDYFRDRVSGAERGWAQALPFAAESGGPAGFALHLALAHSLSYDRQGERDAAVDALLVLAARGQLKTGLLGRQLGEMLRAERIEANRVTASLHTAAETGAYATVWSVLETVLPHLLRDPVVRGTGALLALAVDCAAHCAAKGAIPEVTTAAARTGSSQLVKNARLLRDALG